MQTESAAPQVPSTRAPRRQGTRQGHPRRGVWRCTGSTTDWTAMTNPCTTLDQMVNEIRLRWWVGSRAARTKNTPRVAYTATIISRYSDRPLLCQAHPDGHRTVSG